MVEMVYLLTLKQHPNPDLEKTEVHTYEQCRWLRYLSKSRYNTNGIEPTSGNRSHEYPRQ